jgi:tetratricopeptide (TPR) repeat protein
MKRSFVTPPSQGGTIATGEKKSDLRVYFAREPVILTLLFLSAVALFLGVTGLSHIYYAQRESLANRWFTRGVTDLNAQHFQNAVADFRTALLYSRDDYTYQLNLAEALLGLKRTDEAYAYLLNLWEQEPENGLVNLELARIAAHKREIEQALRYYHNAIYATWPGDQEVQRRETRVELVEYLLSINAKTQSQAELIALAANLADDPVQQARIAALFLRAQDVEHALAEYRLSLKSDRNNPAALAGAGMAAFQLGRYDLADSYLQAAVTANPRDAQSEARLKTTELVLRMNPFQRHLSVAKRDRIVIEAFAAAGERLKSCSGSGNSAGSVTQGSLPGGLAERWEKLQPQITEQGLRRNPDLVEAAMQLVFDIERQTSAACGTPEGTDMALLLIAKLHEGS